jgi:hypothetical protein
MNNEEKSKPLGKMPPPLLIIIDGEEEINVAKYPQLAGKCESNRSRNIPGDLLIIDGPEEVRE